MSFNVTNQVYVRSHLERFWEWMRDTASSKNLSLTHAGIRLTWIKSRADGCTSDLLDEIARADLALQAAKAKEGL